MKQCVQNHKKIDVKSRKIDAEELHIVDL